MEKFTTLIENLPELEKATLERLQEHLDKAFDCEFTLRHINVEFDEKFDILDVLETKYFGSATIKVINRKVISIEGYEIRTSKLTDADFQWFEENALIPHLIHIGCSISSWGHVAKLSNLVSMQAAFNSKPLHFETPSDNALPFLKELSIQRSVECTLDGLTSSLSEIEKVTIERIPEDLISAASINCFVALKELDIKGNSIDNVSELNCPQLDSLILNQPVNLNELENCPNIKLLICQIDTTIPQTKGPSLELLSINNPADTPIVIESINTQCLRSLYINQCTQLAITTPIPTLRQLHIRESEQVGTQFSLSTLHNLPNLIGLDIIGKNVVIDIDPAWTQENLMSLTLQNTNVSDLEFLHCFPNLESLNANANQITSLAPLCSLEHLNYVNVQRNNIIDVPVEVSEVFLLTKERRRAAARDEQRVIALGHNPLISPPIEIIERGIDAIKPYFESMIGETEELNEAKIVFLGNGEVGKTSLMKALNNEDFDAEEETTHGININKFSVPINDRYSVDASIWDFGGQQIMHATHQLFLSRRCVYVLVINDRKEDLHQEQKIDYWLQQVQTFGGNSKVLIVRNKSDMFTCNNIPEGKLKEKYPNLVSIESVSCKTKDNIKRVRDLINQQVRLLPMRKVRLAQNWIRVKDQIKNLSQERDHLPLSQFSDICNANGVTNFEAQMTLRNLLHDLSVVIAFEKLDGFDMGILSPHWITDGIYTLINSKFLEGKKGYIKEADVQRELDREFPGKYVNKARFIIESMIEFELCHRVGNANSGTFLVPSLLPKEIKSKEIKRTGNVIRFIFRYENLLPPSIIPNFLVRMSHQISDDKRWRTGAIMTDTELDVQAIVEEYSVERELRITVVGRQARDYFSVIRHEIRKLNEPNTKALGVKELVPLNSTSTEFVDYDELIGLEVMGKPTYTSGKLMEEFPVNQLLSGIESREETESSVAKQKLLEGIKLSVEVKQGDINVTTGDVVNNVTTSNSTEQSQVATQSQEVDIKIELKSFKGTADYVLEDLKADAEDELINEVDRDKFIKECNRVQRSIKEIEGIEQPEEADDKTGHFMRIRDFLNNALDKVGPVGEAVESLGSNISKVRDMAKKYNKVAGYFGLPIVPEILL